MFLQQKPEKYIVKQCSNLSGNSMVARLDKGLNILPLISNQISKKKTLGLLPQQYIIVGLWQSCDLENVKIRVTSNGKGINAETELLNCLIN